METDNNTEYRLWDGKSWLTFSTLNEFVGDDKSGENLKKITLDLTDYLGEVIENLERLDKLVKIAEKERDSIRGSLHVCLKKAEKDYFIDKTMRYIHDKKDVVVEVAESSEGVMVVSKPITKPL